MGVHLVRESFLLSVATGVAGGEFLHNKVDVLQKQIAVLRTDLSELELVCLGKPVRSGKRCLKKPRVELRLQLSGTNVNSPAMNLAADVRSQDVGSQLSVVRNHHL